MRELQPGTQVSDAFLQNRLSFLIRSVKSGTGGTGFEEAEKKLTNTLTSHARNPIGSGLPVVPSASPNVVPVTTILSNVASGGGGGVRAKDG